MCCGLLLNFTADTVVNTVRATNNTARRTLTRMDGRREGEGRGRGGRRTKKEERIKMYFILSLFYTLNTN
jgi:hypothetical protein